MCFPIRRHLIHCVNFVATHNVTKLLLRVVFCTQFVLIGTEKLLPWAYHWTCPKRRPLPSPSKSLSANYKSKKSSLQTILLLGHWFRFQFYAADQKRAVSKDKIPVPKPSLAWMPSVPLFPLGHCLWTCRSLTVMAPCIQDFHWLTSSLTVCDWFKWYGQFRTLTMPFVVWFHGMRTHPRINSVLYRHQTSLSLVNA